MTSYPCKIINTDQIDSFMPVLECAASLMTEQQKERIRTDTGEDLELILRHMTELFKSAPTMNMFIN